MKRNTKIFLGAGIALGGAAALFLLLEDEAKAAGGDDPFAWPPEGGESEAEPPTTEPPWDPDGLRPGSHNVKRGSTATLLPGERWDGLEIAQDSGSAGIEPLTMQEDQGARGQIETQFTGNGNVTVTFFDDDTPVGTYRFRVYDDVGGGGGGFQVGGITGEASPAPVPEPSFVPSKHENSAYPTPGMMYQVKKGEIFGGEDSKRSIAYRALLTAGYLAGKNVLKLSESKAQAFAREIAKSKVRRAQYIDLIQCAGINDAAYGTWGYSSNARPGPHGRAIRLLPYHVNNRRQLAEGLPLIRNIAMGSHMSPGDGSGVALRSDLRETWEFLLMPRLDLTALASRQVVPAQDGLTAPFEWEIQVEEDGLRGRTFGCKGGEIRL